MVQDKTNVIALVFALFVFLCISIFCFCISDGARGWGSVGGGGGASCPSAALQ